MPQSKYNNNVYLYYIAIHGYCKTSWVQWGTILKPGHMAEWDCYTPMDVD